MKPSAAVIFWKVVMAIALIVCSAWVTVWTSPNLLPAAIYISCWTIHMVRFMLEVAEESQAKRAKQQRTA